jgi:hypothetical protein
MENSKTTELEAVLICSWGFDGSSGHSAYKQRYSDMSMSNINDENLFATTLIPLRLSTSSNIILWNNRASQSARFCRPINIQYCAESKDLILNQKQCIENQIDKLEALEIILNNLKIRIHFSLFMTLIDGKVFNIITGTKSMQSCSICQATPKQFNDLANIKCETEIFLPNPKSLQYGISPLHCWIRFLECCLHISYRLNVKVWQMRGQDLKDEYARRKKEIQTILWNKLGLKVDKPKAGGSGTSNDGNTARRAFEDPKLFSECLGLDYTFVFNLKNILIALSCKFPINSVLFNKLCLDTAKIYVSHYSWYPMPSSLHKVLIHGAQIIENSILPVGMLGEEASEARNKHYKAYRNEHCRKNNRTVNLHDMFCRLMDTSDPIVSSSSLNLRIRKNKILQLPTEVRDLLIVPEINTNVNTEYDEEEEENLTELPEIFSSLDEVVLSDEQVEE